MSAAEFKVEIVVGVTQSELTDIFWQQTCGSGGIVETVLEGRIRGPAGRIMSICTKTDRR